MIQGEGIKRIVLNRISSGKMWLSIGLTKYRIDNNIIHIRFCSTDKLASSWYKFNINPNTLTADYEVWICGNPDIYYLIPIEIIHQIYNDPEAYIDRRHPEIHVVSVNIDRHTVTYAKGGKKINMVLYFHALLHNSTVPDDPF